MALLLRPRRPLRDVVFGRVIWFQFPVVARLAFTCNRPGLLWYCAFSAVSGSASLPAPPISHSTFLIFEDPPRLHRQSKPKTLKTSIKTGLLSLRSSRFLRPFTVYPPIHTKNETSPKSHRISTPDFRTQSLESPQRSQALG
jgi:hypothetical protein